MLSKYKARHYRCSALQDEPERMSQLHYLAYVRYSFCRIFLDDSWIFMLPLIFNSYLIGSTVLFETGSINVFSNGTSRIFLCINIMLIKAGTNFYWLRIYIKLTARKHLSWILNQNLCGNQPITDASTVEQLLQRLKISLHIMRQNTLSELRSPIH